MGDKSAGCLFHAGIVTADEKLTQIARDLFIEDVKKELLLGSDGYTPVFPCGPNIQPNPYADQLDLENEKKYPDFHQNIIKAQYEKIAAAMNLRGGYTILPICDPFALATSLNIDVDLTLKFPDGFLDYLVPNLPKLAIDLDLKPPKLAAKFPGLLTIPPSIPSLKLPTVAPLPQLVDINADFNFALKLKDLILSLAAKIPSLILDIPNMPSAICKLVFDAKLFAMPPDAIVRIAAYKVLVRKISEMLMIVATGKVIGSSPSGVTGGMGKQLGYVPPVEKRNKPKKSIRDKVVSYAEECVDLSWGSKDSAPSHSKSESGETTREVYTQRLLYTEWGDGKAKNTLKKDDPERDARVIGKEKSIIKASTPSSCGMFARACLYAAGASYVFKYNGEPQLNKNPKINRYYDFFQDEYRLFNGEGVAIAAILQAAKTKDARIEKQSGDLPALKKGDLIIVYDTKRSGREHVMVLAEDYVQGSKSLTTIEGGQIDHNNDRKPTAIKKKTYKDPSSTDFQNKTNQTDPPYGFKVSNSGTVTLSGREILALIDSEKLCKSTVGASTSNPTNTLDPGFFDLNDPASDEASGALPQEG